MTTQKRGYIRCTVPYREDLMKKNSKENLEVAEGNLFLVCIAQVCLLVIVWQSWRKSSTIVTTVH